MRSVSVIGIGETKFGKLTGQTIRDLIKEAGEKAIVDAGVRKDQIESLYIGNFNGQYLSNQGHMGPLAVEVLELGHVPAMRLEGACASGSIAFRQGFMEIASGLADVVIVGGVEKMTHRKTDEVTEAIASAADMHTETGVGMTFPSIFAMIAQRYYHEYGDCRDAMTAVAIQNHDNALLNDDAQLRKAVTKEKVESGFPIADPFTVYDCSLVSDGAAFLVLAATDVAQSLNQENIIEIIGSGQAGDNLTIAKKESLTGFKATKLAAEKAYKMAEVGPEDIDLAEVHDCFTITQIINCEDLGFFEPGKAPQGILEGKTAIDSGYVAINPSGGLKAKGHAIGATGISQIFEVVTQLRGDAGERQVKNAIIGMNHNIGGTAATCIVNIFKKL